jgi:hypothetical protein
VSPQTTQVQSGHAFEGKEEVNLPEWILILRIDQDGFSDDVLE